jgi:hypothetical protein
MKSRFLLLIILPLAAIMLPTLFVSCASDDPGNERLQQKLDSRDASYGNRIDRRSMRRSSRDDRYNAWFDMLMQ